MAIEKDRFIDLLDKFIERSDRWIEDAEERDDQKDVYYYQGQKHVIEELKDMASRWK